MSGIALAIPFSEAATAQAHTSARTVYVSTHGSRNAADRNCGSARYKSINAAIGAVTKGGTVVVCGGTYREDVSVAKALTIQGRSGATIDATHLTNGVAIRASNTVLSGFTVKNAIGEGVLVSGANGVTIQNNVVTHNDLGGLPRNPVPNTYRACQAAHGVPGDCGEGIHLMGSSNSTVRNNISADNSGGILLSDETGPTAHNRISGNVVANNVYDCGITVVGHNPAGAPGGMLAPKAAGVYDNVVSGNNISGNGIKGEGAGVVLATGLPGGAVYNNTVENNSISGNGLSGVTVHSHVRGQYLNGNVIRRNQIGTNNLSGDRDFAPAVDLQTTGVLVATVAPLSINITDNVIAKDHFGIWTTGPVTARNVHANVFVKVTVPVSSN